MGAILPNPPVAPSLLDLLKVDNVIAHNALTERFGISPRPFTPENLRYMQRFSALGSLKRFLGQPIADEIQSEEPI